MSTLRLASWWFWVSVAVCLVVGPAALVANVDAALERGEKSAPLCLVCESRGGRRGGMGDCG